MESSSAYFCFLLKTFKSVEFRRDVKKQSKFYLKGLLKAFSLTISLWLAFAAYSQYRSNSEHKVTSDLYVYLQNTYSKLNHYKMNKNDALILCDYGASLSEAEKNKIGFYNTLDYYIKQTRNSRAEVFSTMNKIVDVYGDDIAHDLMKIIFSDLDVVPLPDTYCNQKKLSITEIDRLERKSYRAAYKKFPHLNSYIMSLRESGNAGKNNISAIKSN